MAQNYSNLLTPNQTVPNLIKGFAAKKTPAVTAGPQSMIPQSGLLGGKDPTVSSRTEVSPNGTTTTEKYFDPSKGTSKSSPGAYKGTAITAGDDASVKAQMAKIDNPTQAPQTTETPQKFSDTPLLSGAGTPQTTFGGLVNRLSNTSQDTGAVDKANANLLKLRQDYATKVGNIETTPIPLEFQQGRTQVLGRQYASQEAAAQSALANALTVRGQDIGALGSAAGLANPRSADLLVDPTTGQPIGDVNNMGSALANWSSIRSGASTAGQFTADYQTGLSNLRAADSIGSQIIGTLQTNPTLNTQPLSAITNLKQLISGQVSSGPQQLLSQQINQYIQTLGLDSNTVMNIASQQQGTLGQLLDSLREMAGAQVEAKNPQNIINNPQGTNPTTSGGTPQIVNTAVGPIDNSWFN